MGFSRKKQGTDNRGAEPITLGRKAQAQVNAILKSYNYEPVKNISDRRHRRKRSHDALTSVSSESSVGLPKFSECPELLAYDNVFAGSFRFANTETSPYQTKSVGRLLTFELPAYDPHAEEYVTIVAVQEQADALESQTVEEYFSKFLGRVNAECETMPSGIRRHFCTVSDSGCKPRMLPYLGNSMHYVQWNSFAGRLEITAKDVSLRSMEEDHAPRFSKSQRHLDAIGRYIDYAFAGLPARYTTSRRNYPLHPVPGNMADALKEYNVYYDHTYGLKARVSFEDAATELHFPTNLAFSNIKSKVKAPVLGSLASPAVPSQKQLMCHVNQLREDLMNDRYKRVNGYNGYIRNDVTQIR